MKEDKELIQIRGSGGGKGGSANSTLNADDSMFSRQSASFVDILSEGPIKGLVYGESSIFFDDTRMRDINLATGEVSKDANFQNFVFITKDGSAAQTVNADFFNEFPTSSVVEAKSGAALQYNEPQYFTLSTSAFEKTNDGPFSKSLICFSTLSSFHLSSASIKAIKSPLASIIP